MQMNTSDYLREEFDPGTFTYRLSSFLNGTLKFVHTREDNLAIDACEDDFRVGHIGMHGNRYKIIYGNFIGYKTTWYNEKMERIEK